MYPPGRLLVNRHRPPEPQAARRGLGAVAAMHVLDGIAAWHWWTLAEMEATDEVIWPPGLANLIRGLTG